jgi:iron complex outermembrane receptor protein
MIKFINFSGHEKTYQAWYGVPKDTFQNNPTFNPYTYENQTDNYWQSHYQLHLTHEFNSNIHLHSALHYTKGKGYYESYDEKASFSSYGLPNIIFTNDTIKETDVINQKWLDNDFYGIISSLKIKQKKLHTVIGFSANRYEGLHFGYLIWAQYLPFSIPKYKWYFGTGDKKDINVFIKESYHLSDKIILNGDIQYRYINYKITGKDENLRIVTQEHSYNFINPKGSIQYIINNNQNIVFSFATGRREPTRSDFTDADSGRTPKPELLLDYEFSYRLNNERLLFGFNTYYMDYFNQLVMTGEINSVGTPINTNVNRSFRFGSEIELGIKINDNLKWESNITISRNKIKSFTAYFDDWDNGNQVKKEYKNTDISFSPNSIISSILSYGIKNLEINGIFKYVSSQYLSNIGVEEVKIPSYNTFELLLNYSLKPKFCKALVLQLSVKNIDVKNKAFVTNGWAYSYYYNGKLNHDIAYYPQARNIVLGSMILKF